MLRSSYPKSQFSQKILAIFLCAVVLLSSLGISAQPAAAQTAQEPPESAEFYYHVSPFPHLVIWGSGFPANEVFQVRISIRGEPFKNLDPTFKVKDDGTFEEKYKLPKEYENFMSSFKVKIKSQTHPSWRSIDGIEYRSFLVIPHNQCTPPRFDNKYADLFR